MGYTCLPPGPKIWLGQILPESVLRSEKTDNVWGPIKTESKWCGTGLIPSINKIKLLNYDKNVEKNKFTQLINITYILTILLELILKELILK